MAIDPRRPPLKEPDVDKVTIAKETELGPPSSELLGAEYQKKRRRTIAIVLGILVLGIGGVVAGSFVSAAKAKGEASKKLGALSQCLFGERVDDAPGPLFRRMQLAAMNLPVEARGLGAEAWPQRCGLISQELLEASKSAGLSTKDAKDLGYYPDVLAKALKDPRGHLDDTTELLEQTWAEAKKAGLVPEGSTVTGPPAPPVTPMTIDDLSKLTPLTKSFFPFKEMQFELHPGDEPWFLVQDTTVDPPAFLCKIGKENIECQKLPETVAKSGQGLRFLGTTEPGAAPLLFAGNRGDAGIYRSDTGEKVDAAYSYGAYASKSGGAYVLGWDPAERKPIYITQKRGDAQAKRKFFEPEELEVSNYFYDAQIAYGHVFLRGWDKDNVMKFLDYPIDDATGKLGEPKNIPGLEELGRGGSDDTPYISACQHDKNLVVRVKTGYGSSLLFFIDGKWSGPIPGTGGEYGADVLCTANGAVFTNDESQVRCTSARCDSDVIPSDTAVNPGGLELKPREKLSAVAAIGDRLVWAFAAGDRGGLRVRAGTAKGFDKAKENVFYDDLVEGGKLGSISTVSELKMVSGNGRAVLFMSTKSGVFAMRVDAEGKVTAEPIVWR